MKKKSVERFMKMTAVRYDRMASEGILSNSAVIVSVILLVASVIGMIATGEAEEPDEGIGIVVSILPQAEFARAVGGDNVRVSVMVPQG